MSALKLSVYYGERDRAGRHFLADELAAVFARHELRVSLVMRGTTGFGAKHRLRTDRLLTLSEDLPLVSVAVDDEERIEAAAEDVEALGFHGLVTLERARFADEEPGARGGEVKLTVYLGPRRAGRQPPGVRGRRRRAARPRRRGRHRAARGRRDAARRPAPREPGGPQRRRAADGRVRRRRRAHRGGGRGDRRPAPPPGPDARAGPRVPPRRAALAPPLEVPDGPRVVAEGLGVLLGAVAARRRAALHRPRAAPTEAGAAGATALRGIWGYHGEHEPHGDRLLQLRRRVPVLLVTVDTPANARRWFEIIESATGETGLVTSEIVPAFRAGGEGELKLAPRAKP